MKASASQQPTPIRKRSRSAFPPTASRITADFDGADLTIFGSARRIPIRRSSAQGRYDIIVVLEGPARPATVRRKDRVLGVWVNTQSETFINVPGSLFDRRRRGRHRTSPIRSPTSTWRSVRIFCISSPAAAEASHRRRWKRFQAALARSQGGGRPLQQTGRRRAVPGRRTCFAPPSGSRRTCPSARTRRAPSCSATASSSRNVGALPIVKSASSRCCSGFPATTACSTASAPWRWRSSPARLGRLVFRRD